MQPVIGELLNLFKDITTFLPKLVPGAIILSISWIMGNISKAIASKIGARLSAMKRELSDLVGQVSKSIFIIIGTVLALSKIGININALVASLGLTGFALGFALRDILSNVLSGALIFIYRPFNIHDRISVTGLAGEVTDIDLRYTTISADDRIFLLPNSILFNNAVQIINKDPKDSG